jgi:lipopolysaccharide export system permease protein
VRILDTYIAKQILYQVSIAVAVLVGLFTFLTFIDQLSDIGTGSYGVLDAVRFVILSTPRILYEIFPMSALLGSILGMSSLAVDSELVVIRASGVSVARLTGSVLRVGAFLALAAVLLGEVITPYSETMAQRGRAQALQENINQQSDFGLWMRDNESYVNVGEVLPDLSLLDVRVFEFDDEGRLRSLVFAAKGNYVEEAQRWRLQDIAQTLIDKESATSQTARAAYWSTDVTREIMSVFMIRPDQLSAFQLYQYISHLRDNGQETEAYELAFWTKIATPLATAVMVILAIPFVFRSVRSGGYGGSLFAGIMIGLAFFVMDKGFGLIIQIFDISPFVGAFLPTTLFAVVGAFFIRRVF